MFLPLELVLPGQAHRPRTLSMTEKGTQSENPSPGSQFHSDGSAKDRNKRKHTFIQMKKIMRFKTHPPTKQPMLESLQNLMNMKKANSQVEELIKIAHHT